MKVHGICAKLCKADYNKHSSKAALTTILLQSEVQYDIMIDRETPLAEIIGQMSLSRSTDVSTQSWVFISVKRDLTKLARWLYTHKRRELMAGDEDVIQYDTFCLK